VAAMSCQQEHFERKEDFWEREGFEIQIFDSAQARIAMWYHVDDRVDLDFIRLTI
jgi:hypothetical protein